MPSTIEQLITGRRTIHNFKARPVPPPSVLRAGLDAARWAPNHRLTEPWHIYLPGPETQEAICRLNAELVAETRNANAAGKKLKRWRAMPGWLVMTAERASDPVTNQENYAACCCMVQNLALYLWDQGIGLKWSTGDVVRDPRFFDLLRADGNRERVVGLFWYGYPAEIPQTHRAPVGESLTELP